ncbi:hypothetical protein GCU56_05770 [Geodermatophilus sabuli]|uniref:Uncharacterized protein n=1 Tax=Geodermatophilus sabuli TaxID=1564158 RepID=A0A7K3VY92_9ACTN|nr:hypothetical protein [Geodermatophilus sabuli]NEK57380.1 hypothetical protein [Geodermatophilus sabuli]
MTTSPLADRPPTGPSPLLRLAHLLGPDLALVAMACGAPVRPRDVVALRASRREQLGGSR